jgi:streptogramin lyase
LNHDRMSARHFNGRLGNLACAALLLVLLCDVRGAAAASGFALWVPNEDSSTITEFQGRLAAGVHRVNRSPDLDGSSTIAFDNNGNLWESNFNGNSIVEFTQAQISALRRNPAPSATVIISEDGGGTLNGPEGITFDAAGNLWVGAENGQLILMYTPAQLAASGNPTPSLILNGNSFSFSSPSLPIFDTAGNLWIVDEDISNGVGGTGEIFEYTSAQVSVLRSESGIIHVDPVLGVGSPDFTHLEGMAFDSSGNLWVADEEADTVDKILASQINPSGLSQNITPAVVLSPANMPGRCNQSFNAPYGVAINAAGDLFVGGAGTTASCKGSLAKFPAKRITVSGSPKPSVFISSNLKSTNLDVPNYLTFGPTIP